MTEIHRMISQLTITLALNALDHVSGHAAIRSLRNVAREQR